MTSLPLVAASLLCASALLSAGASAQDSYPSRPIRLIAPSSPGSGVDLVSRTLATPLSAELGHQVVVDNRAGAGGNIGAEIAAKSPADGYTLMMCTPSQVINAILHQNLSPNLLREFAPITLVSSGQFVLIVHPSFPAKTPAQLIQLAKAKPGGVAYGSAGQGNVTHLAGELFRNAAGVDLLHVPYKGSGPALVDVMGGQIQSMFANLAAAIPHIRSGKVHAIASTGAKRARVTPEVPTFAESGVKGYLVLSWFGLVAPKGMPREAMTRVHAAMLKVLRSAEISERMSRDALDPVGSTPREFADYLEREAVQWARAVRISGAKAG